MEITKENSIILVKNGEQKVIELPEHGELIIKINQGMPVQIEANTKRRFEDI